MNALYDGASVADTYLGIELGSTRIKATLIGPDYKPLASGSHDWENRLENGFWTYHIDDVWTGVQSAYAAMAAQAERVWGAFPGKLGGIGISAMMHGYLPFDAKGRLLAPFRTWRNTTTERASSFLTARFGFNIPQRWSIAHLCQAILDGEPHVKEINFMTTLAGYVHWMLTGEKSLGIGDASGMFPIDSRTNAYDAGMIKDFNAFLAEQGLGDLRMESILPPSLPAGVSAGSLSPEGAARLDPSGRLEPGVPFCPPEGDAGTGMVATCSVEARRGNVSAGTSVFAMIVLERPLSKVYREIDLVTTPEGKSVAMVHCNNCTSDIDAWFKLISETLEAFDVHMEKSVLYDRLYEAALKGDADCGGLLSYNYLSGEPITGLDAGRPLFVRLPGSPLTLANFARTLLFSAMATLKVGMDILTESEGVLLDALLGHGGFFKTPRVGQCLMASALGVPVSVMASAGEGGPWGMALLAAYMAQKAKGCADGLGDFLSGHVFAGNKGLEVLPDPAISEGFKAWFKSYMKGLEIEKAAVAHFA